MSQPDYPASLEEVAALIRDNLPRNLTVAEFGKLMNWGRGNQAALARISTITLEQLRETKLSCEQANNWSIAYEAVTRIAPNNPSASGRAELMRHVARMLVGE